MSLHQKQPNYQARRLLQESVVGGSRYAYSAHPQALLVGDTNSGARELVCEETNTPVVAGGASGEPFTGLLISSEIVALLGDGFVPSEYHNQVLFRHPLAETVPTKYASKS